MLEWVLNAKLLSLADFSYHLFFPASFFITSPYPASYFFPLKIHLSFHVFNLCTMLYIWDQ